jgi:hypothetical protein
MVNQYFLEHLSLPIRDNKHRMIVQRGIQKALSFTMPGSARHGYSHTQRCVIIPNSVSFTREIMLPLPPGAFCGYPQGGSIQPSSVLARWTPMDPETCGTSPGNRVADQSRPLHSSPHLKNRRSPSPRQKEGRRTEC